MTKKYEESAVLLSLRNKKDVKITANKEILVLNGKSPKFPKQNDLGNGSWAKIGFLIKKHNYKQIFVSEF